MKRKELEAAKAAGQTVAYAEYGPDTDHAAEVEIIDTQAVRQVSARGRAYWADRGHAAHGIRIRYTSGINANKQDVVAAVKLLSIWSKYAKDRDARKKFQDSKEQRLATRKAQAEFEALRLRVAYRTLAGYDKDYWYGLVEVMRNGHSAGNHYVPATRYFVQVAPQVLKTILDTIDAVGE